MIVNAKGELGSQTRHQVLALANVFLTLSSVRVSMNVLFYIKTNADVGCFFPPFLSIKTETESAEATVPSEVPKEKSRQHEARPNRHHNINI